MHIFLILIVILIIFAPVRHRLLVYIGGVTLGGGVLCLALDPNLLLVGLVLLSVAFACAAWIMVLDHSEPSEPSYGRQRRTRR